MYCFSLIINQTKIQVSTPTTCSMWSSTQAFSWNTAHPNPVQLHGLLMCCWLVNSVVWGALLKAQQRSYSFFRSPLHLFWRDKERQLSRMNVEWFLSMCLWIPGYPVQVRGKVFTSSVVEAGSTGPAGICTKLKPKVIPAKKNKLLKLFCWTKNNIFY